MITCDSLYKVDSKGKLRVYFIELEGDKYRMVTGLQEGNLVTSKWTVAKPKNVGRSNETTAEGQASLEVLARYTKKRDEGYFDTMKEAEDNSEGKFFEPMLAETWEKVTDTYKQFPLIADPKLDGMRMTIRGTDCISRKGNAIMTADHIINDLYGFFELYPNVRLDGELYNHELKDDFNTLMSIARQSKPSEEDLKIAREKLQFHIYDCYNYDIPSMSAIERKRWIKNIFVSYLSSGIKSIDIVPYAVVRNQFELDVVKEQNLILGYEGTITRGIESVYENKRSRWLLKHKDFITEEFKVVNVLAGKGNRSGIAGTVEVMLDGRVVGCGIRGSHEYAFELLKNKDNYIGKQATVRHFGKTDDGSLRFPVCIDIDRPDL